MSTLTREELVDLVVRIRDFKGIDEELSVLAELLMKNVPHPTPLDLIFWNEDDLPPEDIVDVALNYKPLSL